MSFVFRNGQIAAVASASGEEEIKQQTVEKSSRRQRGNSLCKSFPVTHGDSCDLCRSLYRSIEKDVEHAERPGCRTATVEIHRNVFCIVDSRKERFSLFKRCGEGRQTGCVFGNAGGIFQRDAYCLHTAFAGSIREPYPGAFAALRCFQQFTYTPRAECNVTFDLLFGLGDVFTMYEPRLPAVFTEIVVKRVHDPFAAELPD